MTVFRKVATVDQVPEGRGIALEIEGRRLAIFNIEGNFHAVEAACAQHRAPLERGVIYEGTLHCPWHGVAFDVDRGICSAFPNEISTTTYEVRLEGNDILLRI